MAYEVTATRRRPQRFEDLAGQEFVASTLQNSIDSKKIAHAYLFSGPRGCGKTSSARILAKSLNCDEGPTSRPCGKCTHCVEITRGSSMDVIEIDGASNTSVNDVRQIRDEVIYPPNSSRYKIYIIDEVHMLSTSAFNALLKTIEEPPEYVVFVFATTELHKVPATIKSRCQQFGFRLVPAEKVRGLLAEAASELGVQAEDEALYWIARESTGSIRDAYTLFDQVLAFSGGSITYEKIRDKLGLAGVDRLNAFFESCVRARPDSAVETLHGLLEGGISIEQFISNAADYLRNLLLIKAGVRKESVLGQSAERFSAEVLGAWSAVQVERALSIFFQLFRDIRYSVSPRAELELAASRLCWLREYVSPQEVKAAIDRAQSLLQGAPNPPAPQQAAQPDFTRNAAQNTQQNSARVPDFIANFASQNSAAASSGSTSPQDFGGGNFGGAAFQPNAGPFEPAPEAQAPVPPARNLGAEELRQAVVAEVQSQNPMAAAILGATGGWKVDKSPSGAKVSCQAQSALAVQQIQAAKTQILAAVRKFAGADASFEAAFEPQAESKPAAEDVPPLVAFVADCFKGEILASTESEPEPSSAESQEAAPAARKPADTDSDSGDAEGDSDDEIQEDALPDEMDEDDED